MEAEGMSPDEPQAFIFEGNYEKLVKDINKDAQLAVLFFLDKTKPECKKLAESLPEILEGTFGLNIWLIDNKKNPELVKHFKIKKYPHIVYARKKYTLSRPFPVADEIRIHSTDENPTIESTKNNIMNWTMGQYEVY